MSNQTATQQATTALTSALGSKVSLPGSLPYTRSQSSYFVKQNQSLRPACHVCPTSTQDVSLALRTLARFPEAKFAVRGGGHNLNEGISNRDDGVVLSLRDLNAVDVDDDKGIVRIGGGAIWVEVYRVLSAKGLSCPGGRVAEVGVGGLTTGGGISFFSSRYGMVCDNVLNFELVSANGETIQANGEENPELWWALKGGSGSNFGVVTRIDMRVFQQKEFLGGVLILDPSTQDQQYENYGRFLESFDPYAAILFSITWNATLDVVYLLANLEYSKEGVTDPECFRPFREDEGLDKDTLRVSTLEDFVVEAGMGRTGLLNQFATTTFAGGLPMIRKAHSLWRASLPGVANIAGMNWSLTIQPIWPAYSAHTQESGGNALPLDPDDEPLTLLLISWSWDDVAETQKGIDAAKQFIEDVDAAAREMGAYRAFRYLNYCADWQRPFEGYKEEDVERLREVARSVDPEGVMQRQCHGGFKLF